MNPQTYTHAFQSHSRCAASEHAGSKMLMCMPGSAGNADIPNIGTAGQNGVKIKAVGVNNK